MGDRTPIEVIVYSCPPTVVAEVLDVLEEFGLLDAELPAPAAAGADPNVGLELGHGYVRNEVLVGSSEDLAAALPSRAAWKVWEDPAYEHLGEVHLNYPDLGRFRADCDALGRPMFASEEIERLIARTDGDRTALNRTTGRAWERVLEQLGQDNEGVVLQSWTATTSTPLQTAALKEPPDGPTHAPPATDAGRNPRPAPPDR